MSRLDSRGGFDGLKPRTTVTYRLAISRLKVSPYRKTLRIGCRSNLVSTNQLSEGISLSRITQDKSHKVLNNVITTLVKSNV